MVVGGAGIKSILSNAKKSKSFFDGATFDKKVLEKMGRNDFHSFPSIVRNFEKHGSLSNIKDANNVQHVLLKIPGFYGGKSGSFEYIKTLENVITHRFFRPD